MFGWAALFLLIALVAAVFGFSGVAVGAASAAKVVFVAALLVTVLGAIIAARWPRS
jgi:uncharacterized membrane protein YtjA (UPF0391 family)